MKKLDLNLLRLFDVLLAERSVTRAGRRLDLTQSATSSALARLRQSFDDPLFIHTSQGLVTTAKAEAIAETVQKCLAQIDGITSPEAPFSPAATQKRFRIRAPDHALGELIQYLLPILQRDAPSIQCEFQFLSGDDILGQMTVGELDIVISYFSSKRCESLKATRLFTERVVTIAARDHPRIKRKLTMKDYIEAEHVVLRPQGTWIVSPVDRALQKMGIEPRKVRMTMPSHLIAPMIVESSDMLATVPDKLAQQFAKDHAIRVFPMPFKAPIFEFSMAWHERAHRDPAHRWIRTIISKWRDKQ